MTTSASTDTIHSQCHKSSYELSCASTNQIRRQVNPLLRTSLPWKHPSSSHNLLCYTNPLMTQSTDILSPSHVYTLLDFQLHVTILPLRTYHCRIPSQQNHFNCSRYQSISRKWQVWLSYTFRVIFVEYTEDGVEVHIQTISICSTSLLTARARIWVWLGIIVINGLNVRQSEDGGLSNGVAVKRWHRG